MSDFLERKEKEKKVKKFILINEKILRNGERPVLFIIDKANIHQLFAFVFYLSQVLTL